MISLGLLGSWTEGVFPFLLAGHLFLGLGAEGPVVEGCVSSLVG